MNFGNILKELRINDNLSQSSLGKSIGVSGATICCWEKNQKEPTATNIKNTAIFFKVSTDFLLGIEDICGNKINTLDNKHHHILDAEKLHHIEIFSTLNANNKRLCTAYAKGLSDSQTKTNKEC